VLLLLIIIEGKMKKTSHIFEEISPRNNIFEKLVKINDKGRIIDINDLIKKTEIDIFSY